jgi:hypothetical protein
VVVGGQTGFGAQAAIGRTADGDLCVGKDEIVYRRTDDGWKQNAGEGWSPVDVPDGRAVNIDEARNDLSARRETAAQSIPTERSSSAQMQSTFSSRGFANSDGARSEAWSSRTYDSTRTRSPFDGSRRSELGRVRKAGTNGYQRYNSRSLNTSGLNRQPGMRRLRRP